MSPMGSHHTGPRMMIIPRGVQNQNWTMIKMMTYSAHQEQVLETVNF